MLFRTRSNESGSAMVLAIGVGTIVLLLVFGWAAFSVRQTRSGLHDESELRARYAAESVISKSVYALMAAQAGVPFVDTIKIAGDSVLEQMIDYSDSVHSSSASAMLAHKGPFLRIRATGRSKQNQCIVEAQFGRELSAEFRYALILTDARPLKINNGLVRGDIQAPFPPAGQFEGKYQKGASWPNVDFAPFLNVMGRFGNRIRAPQPGDSIVAGPKAYSRKNPVPLKQNAVLFVDGPMLIDNPPPSPEMVLEGPATLIVTRDLQISGNVRLDNLEILVRGRVNCFDQARFRNVTICSQGTIYFDDQVRFWGSLYAGESIILNNQAYAESPTLAFIAGAGKPARSFFLGQEARFEGVMVCKDNRIPSGIAKTALFTGVLYTLGPLALEGTVHGCVAARSLVNDFAPGQNALWNGRIMRNQLSPHFVLPVTFGKPGQDYKLMKWTEARQ